MSQPFKTNGISQARISQIDNPQSSISSHFIKNASNTDERLKTNSSDTKPPIAEIDFFKTDKALSLPPYSIFDSTSIALSHRHPTRPTQDSISDFLLGFTQLENRGLKDFIQSPSAFHNELKYDSFLSNNLFPIEKTRSLQSLIITKQTQRNFAAHPILRSAHLQIANLALEKFDLKLDDKTVLVKGSFKTNPPIWAKKEGKEERKLLRQIIKSLFLLQNPKAAKKLCSSIANLLKFNGLNSSATSFLKLKESFEAQAYKIKKATTDLAPAISTDIGALKNAAEIFFYTLDSKPLKKHLAKIHAMKLQKEEFKPLFELKNPGNQSLIWVAAFNGMDKLLTLLLDTMPADTPEQIKASWLNPINENQASALYVAVQNGHTNTVNILLDAIESLKSVKIKADILSQKINWGASLLYMAAFNNHTDLVKRIIRTVTHLHNDDLASQLIHAKNHQGITPLHLAALNGNAEIFNALISHLQNPLRQLSVLNSTSNLNKTPLHLALQYSHLNIVESICEAAKKLSADAKFELLNCKNYLGRSALHLAAQKGNMDIVRLLCDMLSSIGDKEKISDLLEARTLDGFNAVQIAKNNGHHLVSSYLELTYG